MPALGMLRQESLYLRPYSKALFLRNKATAWGHGLVVKVMATQYKEQSPDPQVPYQCWMVW